MLQLKAPNVRVRKTLEIDTVLLVNLLIKTLKLIAFCVIRDST